MNKKEDWYIYEPGKTFRYILDKIPDNYFEKVTKKDL